MAISQLLLVLQKSMTYQNVLKFNKEFIYDIIEVF